MQEEAVATKPEMRTYPYEHLIMGDDWGGVTIFKNPKYHPSEHYLGQGEYRNWTMEGYEVEKFAKMILFGLVEVIDVPQQIWVHEIDKMQTWFKVMGFWQQYKEKGFTVDECPHCGSKDIEYDGDSETDGCESDWATWNYWYVNCNDCDDFSHKGKYVGRSGGY